jgi:hypothetical protein
VRICRSCVTTQHRASACFRCWKVLLVLGRSNTSNLARHQPNIMMHRNQMSLTLYMNESRPRSSASGGHKSDLSSSSSTSASGGTLNHKPSRRRTASPSPPTPRERGTTMDKSKLGGVLFLLFALQTFGVDICILVLILECKYVSMYLCIFTWTYRK